MKVYKPTYRYLFVLCLLSTVYGCNNNAATASEDAAPAEVVTPVTVATASKDTMTDYIQLNATATFLLKTYIKSNANGYLHSADIHLGQLVNKGKLLFTITTKEAQSIGNAVNKLDSTFKFSGNNSLHAAANGFVTQLDHQQGDYVQDGEQLAVISNSNSFAFIMNMPYELRPFVISKSSVQVVLPDGEILQGTIGAQMPVVDSAAQTQSLVIHVNPSHTIPENLVAKVRIVKTFKPSAVTLPKAAVLTDETQTNFWVMKMIGSATAVKMPVKKGMESSGRIEILSPAIADSDRFLISGNYGLGDTAKVKIISSPE
ncbi:HlyD family efflux transporter periplasmic adaptor subunit [Chitinophagaceae bacterium 26-R-25]|nr:HlyD family efflux transporter periplasmic adaptor subunit [Chitinophagaceae bacterium 26-R-25]